MNKKLFLAAKILSLAGFLVLLGFIIFGVAARDFSAEGSILMSVFWGKFTMLDIYIAFLVFYIWVVIRERSIIKRVLWFFLIMLGGSMSICLYLFIALITCDDHLIVLMLGRQLEDK